jgi:hypothetical protein
LSPIARRLAPLLLILLGSVVSFVLLESALRVYDATRPLPPEPRGSFWKQLHGYGWLHYPGIEGRWFDDHGEFSVDVKMSSHGLRDVEHDYEKPAGTFRILVLGDSYMEAVQVELEQIFARQLERELGARGRRVEVINASASDWGTDNELVYLREEGWRYSPDLVLLAFTTANDVRNNSVVLNQRVPNPNPWKPTFTVAADGKLVFHPMPALPPPEPLVPPRPWWRRSRALSFFANRIGPFLSSPEPATGAPAAKTNDYARTLPADMLVYAPDPPPEVDEAWRVTKALLLEMKNDAREHGARFAMVLVDGPWTYYDAWWQLMTMWDQQARSWNPARPNEVLGEFAHEAGIESLDLRTAFTAKKSEERLYFEFDPHWTPAGHRLAAQAAAGFLVERGLVPEAR